MSFNRCQTAHHILQGVNGWILDIDEQLERCASSQQNECVMLGKRERRSVEKRKSEALIDEI